MHSRLSREQSLEAIVADFTQAFRDGKQPVIADYLRKYPDQADELQELLSSVAMIEGLKQESDSTQARSREDRDALHIKQLGDYQLIRELGRGGMGVVFEAVHQSLGRRVAIKLMHPRHSSDEKYIARFSREAQAAAKLHHTNIVSVFGVGHCEGRHYYVMELVRGCSLKSVMRSLSGTVRLPTVFRQHHDIGHTDAPAETKLDVRRVLPQRLDSPIHDSTHGASFARDDRAEQRVNDKVQDHLASSASAQTGETGPTATDDRFQKQLPTGSQRFRWVARIARRSPMRWPTRIIKVTSTGISSLPTCCSMRAASYGSRTSGW